MIRAFEGPRHERLEKIWTRFAQNNCEFINLNIYENRGAKRRHDECLEAIWECEQKLPEDRCIITEFDFLPYLSIVQWPFSQLSHNEPVQAAEYCTRDPVRKTVQFHGIPGAWFIRISKRLLRKNARLDLRAGGRFNDPANRLDEVLKVSSGQRVKLLKSEDCYPRHFGVRVLGAGEHLFWARHYNSNPLTTAAGFKFHEIHEAVDKAIDAFNV